MNSEDFPHHAENEKSSSSGQTDYSQGFAEGFVKGFDKGSQKSAGKQEEKASDEKATQEHKAGEPEDKKKGVEKPKRPLYKKPAFIIIVSLSTAFLLVVGIVIWLVVRQFVATDDAYIDGHVTQVSPRASAQVLALYVQDNQLVHQGDLLVELDPTDYQVALAQAKAQVVSSQGRLTQAQAQVTTATADVAQAAAGVDAAQVQLDNATHDVKRYEEVDERARSRQQLDNAQTAQKNAQAQFKEAQAKKASADANVASTEASIAAAEGEVQTSQANQKRAEVNLSYCRIYAPTEGRVTQRTVEVGNYVAVGQALFMLADPRVWVTANYKETQLNHMRMGQTVTVWVDAFPGLKWRAHVDSIQAGSGSRFSILPAENATGNYVKVVQRVPVKIVFDEPVNTNNAVMLSAGMSVIPHVKIR